MAKEYLERLTALMRQASAGNSRKVGLECKHFFSGAAVYANGKICMSLTPVGFAIKLPEKSRRALLKQASAKPLRYFSQRADQERVRRLTENNLERRQSFSAIGKNEY